MSASETVLVTGACGLVGSTLVDRLARMGRRVVATDLDIPKNRKTAATLPTGVAMHWVDLTDAASVDALVAGVAPTAIAHLAAIIPPRCYARPVLARNVNVGATALLVNAASAQARPPRFLQASSVAVYGARNPYQNDGVLDASTPLAPCDLYGTHKVEAEDLVKTSVLDWVVLRLGGVLSARPRFDLDFDTISFEGLLPVDGRIQTVDVRDVAAAFDAAITMATTREVLLIGGDESHRLTQGDISPAVTAAMGLPSALPRGRRGDPDSERDWFATDWVDSRRAQAVLGFQHHSWPDMLAELVDRTGFKRYAFRPAAPLLRWHLTRRSPNLRRPGPFADPWGAIRDTWGEPGPDAAP